MKTLDRALAGVTETISVPWPQLEKEISPGPGHLIVVLGAPGVGKSAFALSWALGLPKPQLYLSLDSDLATQAARTVSALSGIRFSEVKQDIEQWEAWLKVRDRDLPWMLDASLSAHDVDGVVESFVEFYSRTPELIIIDNLKDVVGADTYEAHRDAVRELHRVAKKRRAVVLLLHHLNRGSRAGEGTSRPSARDGQFTGEQDAEFMLGLWQEREGYYGDTLNVSILKNRFGPKDIDVKLNLDLERMKIG